LDIAMTKHVPPIGLVFANVIASPDVTDAADGYERFLLELRHILTNHIDGYFILLKSASAVHPQPTDWRKDLEAKHAYQQSSRLFAEFKGFIEAEIRMRPGSGNLKGGDFAKNILEPERLVAGEKIFAPQTTASTKFLSEDEASRVQLALQRYLDFIDGLREASEPLPISFDKYLELKRDGASLPAFKIARRALLDSNIPGEQASARETIYGMFPSLRYG
jgi:hypothetical protein